MRLRLPDTHYDNVGQKLSATKVNQLVRATQHLDGWSFRRMNTFDSAAGDSGVPFYLTGGGYHSTATDPQRIWKGGALMKTGATTLTISGAATPGGSEFLNVYVNGALLGVVAAPLPATWSLAMNITGLALTDGQPIWATVWVLGTAADITRFARYYVYEAYLTPVTAPTPAWAAPTAFTTTLPAAKIEAIKAAITWIYARMNLIPQIPRMALLYEPGPYRDPAVKPEMTNWPLYYGSVLRGFSATEGLRINMQSTNYTSPQERWKLYIDGVLIYTSPTRGPGTYVDSILPTISHAVGTRKEVWILAECLVAGVDAPPTSPIRKSRYQLLTARTEAAAAGYPYWAPPTEWVYGTKTFANVIAALNSIVTQLIAIKARIDAAPHIWGRYSLQRKFYGYDDSIHGGELNKRGMPQLVRGGDRLVVQGKGVSLNYANFILPPEEDKALEKFTFGRTEPLIGTEAIERKSIYLENYPDLFLGTAYYMLSDLDMLIEEYFY